MACDPSSSSVVCVCCMQRLPHEMGKVMSLVWLHSQLTTRHDTFAAVAMAVAIIEAAAVADCLQHTQSASSA